MENDRLRVVVDLDNLVHNYNLLKELNKGDVIAVVKADAYGHGSINCALHLENNGCNFFAVTCLAEAVELRNSGVKSPILIFGKTDVKNASILNEFKLIQTVDSLEYAKALNEKNYQIQIHLNIDTAMSRLGIRLHKNIDLENAVNEVKMIDKLDNLRLKGIYTHFADADKDLDFTINQKQLLKKLLSRLNDLGLDYGIVHLSNSAGIVELNNEENYLARSGIALYGYPPVKSEHNFKVVAEEFAKVIAIRDINKNDSVSYNRTFIAEHDMKIATIAIGYADGYPRILSNNDYFYYKGNKLNVIGRVCMGLTIVDISGVDISIGDEVEIFGKNKPLELMAKNAQTITYELLTNLSKPRVLKEYKTKS
ncbi:MAG: alanine racemase [Candidatus Izemoplasmatales bacterium]